MSINNTSDIEFESKFYPVNKTELKKRLQKIGAKLALPERLMRRSLVDQRVYSQLKCDYIRHRNFYEDVWSFGKRSD